MESVPSVYMEKSFFTAKLIATFQVHFHPV